jgi:hypothetical protein
MAYDLVIRNGTLIDGTGAPRRLADVAVADGRIAAVGSLDDSGREEIDAEGHVVAPGFVDGHILKPGLNTGADRHLIAASSCAIHRAKPLAKVPVEHQPEVKSSPAPEDRLAVARSRVGDLSQSSGPHAHPSFNAMSLIAPALSL